ncbi:MAG: glycosyltransferase family 4 protein [Clostridia bacterium]|nr:glycosyltransferase family 4 protein [Clostridia bacterium]
MIKLGMLSKAAKGKGHGVGSAYMELVRLLQTYGKQDFCLVEGQEAMQADVIHVHTVDLDSYFKMQRTNKPTIVSVHMTPEMAHNSIRLPGFCLKAFEWYIVRTYKSADYVHIVNPDLKEVMQSFGVPEDRIRYIPNFVAKSRFYKKTADERRRLREKYGIPDDAFVAFADGQTREGKGVKDFVAVAKMLPDVRFIWAGGFSFGRLADGYPDTKDMLDCLPDNVRFTGIVEREEINDLLNISDLFFFPSYQELFPMSILEAANVGLPLLLRDLPEYKNTLNGRYMTATDNDAFAAAIRQIQSDRVLHDRLVADAADIAAQYSEDATYQIWKEFYESCMKGERGK